MSADDDDDVRKKLPAPPIDSFFPSMSPASTVFVLLLQSSENDPNILRMLMFDGAIIEYYLVFAAWLIILCIVYIRLLNI